MLRMRQPRLSVSYWDRLHRKGSLIATAVLNAASYQPGIEAGSWVMIQGTNLAASSRTWESSDFTGVALPTVVDGVSVTIDGNLFFVEYISPLQSQRARSGR